MPVSGNDSTPSLPLGCILRKEHTPHHDKQIIIIINNNNNNHRQQNTNTPTERNQSKSLRLCYLLRTNIFVSSYLLSFVQNQSSVDVSVALLVCIIMSLAVQFDFHFDLDIFYFYLSRNTVVQEPNKSRAEPFCEQICCVDQISEPVCPQEPLHHPMNYYLTF